MSERNKTQKLNNPKLNKPKVMTFADLQGNGPKPNKVYDITQLLANIEDAEVNHHPVKDPQDSIDSKMKE